MNKYRKEFKLASRIFLERLIGFLFFIVLLLIANYLAIEIKNELFISIVSFFNNNLPLLIVLTFVSIIGEMFWVTSFPFKLPAPIFSGFTSILIIEFIVRILIELNQNNTFVTFSQFFELIDALQFVIFVIVLASGYVKIFVSLFKKKHKEEKEELLDEIEEIEESQEEDKPKKKSKKEKSKAKKKISKNKKK